MLGSSIFNTFLCPGAAGPAGSVGAPLHEVGVDLVALGVTTGLAAVLIRTERTISRREGGVALALYLAFTALTVARG